MKSKQLSKISKESFLSRTKEGENLAVCFGFVIDLANFSSQHPGGDFMHHFVGKDLTPWMLITHSKSEQALKMLSLRAIGVLDGPVPEGHPFNLSLLPSIDADYVKMFFEFNNRGEFASEYIWIFQDFFEVYFPLFFGYALMLKETEYSLLYNFGFFLMCLAAGRQGLLYHDVMHKALFSSFKTGRDFVYYSSMIIWSFNFNIVGDVHDVHHGFVNIIGLDTAIDMPFLPCDKKQVELKKKGIPSFLREKLFAANALFYGVLAWMVLPYYSLYPFFARLLTPKEIALALARFALMYFFWEYQYQFFASTLAGFFYFASVGSLNHFHKEMTTPDVFFNSQLTKEEKGKLSSFVALQTQTVQNTDHGPIVDILLGHFTLHIEHHLFPQMPRRNYAKVSKEIQQFLAKHQLDYSLCSQFEALSSFNNTLRFPENKKQ